MLVIGDYASDVQLEGLLTSVESDLTLVLEKFSQSEYAQRMNGTTLL
jgi:hypothetical protein